MIIEDDDMLREMYRDKLEEAGCEVIEAGDAQKGMKLILTEKPDLIVLDLILPKGNGFELMEKLKKRKDTKLIPVVILTSLGQESDRQEMIEKGAVDYLVKPEIGLSEVAEAIKKHLK